MTAHGRRAQFVLCEQQLNVTDQAVHIDEIAGAMCMISPHVCQWHPMALLQRNIRSPKVNTNSCCFVFARRSTCDKNGCCCFCFAAAMRICLKRLFQHPAIPTPRFVYSCFTARCNPWREVQRHQSSGAQRGNRECGVLLCV